MIHGFLGLPESYWVDDAARLLISTVATIALIATMAILVKRPRPAHKTTWAQAMGGAVAVWGAFVLTYGILPHEWLNFADAFLGWREDFIYRGGIYDSIPIDITGRVYRDIVASGIYGYLVFANIMIFSKWQKRPLATIGDAIPDSTDVPVDSAPKKKRSAFGRPVAQKG